MRNFDHCGCDRCLDHLEAFMNITKGGGYANED
jgi:hypothetical protein